MQKWHTMGYLFAGWKHVDVCTLSYHHGAQTPSIGFGPATHLNVLHRKLVMYTLSDNAAEEPFYVLLSLTLIAQNSNSQWKKISYRQLLEKSVIMLL